MHITQKAVTSFNRSNEPCFNESYNKAHGIHSMKEHALFLSVQQEDSGIMKQPISLKKVREYIKWNPDFIEQLNDKYKRFE
jgi:hypothetical protein